MTIDKNLGFQAFNKKANTIFDYLLNLVLHIKMKLTH